MTEGSTVSTEGTVSTESTIAVPEQVTAEHLTIGKYFSQQQEWDDEILLALSEYNAVTLLGDSIQKYPVSAEALEQTRRMIIRSMEDEFDNLLATAKDELALLGADSFVTKSSTLDVQLRRADSVAVSLLSDSCLVYGNINGRYLNGTTYDTVTGETLMITDIIKDMNRIPTIVKMELTSHMWTGDFTTETAVEDYFRDTPEDSLAWTLDYNGVTFYFGNGDVAEIGQHGRLAATVSFAKYPDLFEEKYMAVPDSYMVELPLKHPFYTDLDGDGAPEEFNVTPVSGDDGLSYESFDIYTDTETQYHCAEFPADITHRTGGYHPYYLKTADGKHYLYVFAEGSELAAGDMKLYVIDITGGEFKKVGDMHVAPGYVQADCAWALTDPNNMMLENFELMEETAAYRVGDDGMPMRK
ncbi:MAG: hypothetical protein E7578_00140 [Ruminococcaceae bacterium]|nr:hypothetical protein [Oscillospiraceae bacterium]